MDFIFAIFIYICHTIFMQYYDASYFYAAYLIDLMQHFYNYDARYFYVAGAPFNVALYLYIYAYICLYVAYLINVILSRNKSSSTSNIPVSLSPDIAGS